MVDRDVLKQRLSLLCEYIDDLDQAAAISLDDFLKDKVTRRYIERTLQLAIEACLDIGSHLIADLKLREPADNKDIFTVLVESGFLPGERKNDYRKMAGFRNIIVHDYVRLDPEIVYGILENGISDLRGFSRAIKMQFLS
ncbi:MAG: DUF86 domain-containing protein [Dethiobacter sp.]|jgi:uncharacterized protein YutE (UPF0331/DUF86 family)|nr:DUF86 domain-containing protein [Dethiobacter sp.]